MSTRADRAAKLRPLVQALLEKHTVREAETITGVSRTALSDFVEMGRTPQERVLARLEAWAGEAAQAADPASPPDEWAEFSLGMVRLAGGGDRWNEEQRYLIRLDLLEGLIRLGVAEGKDVRRLQEEQQRLQAEGPPARSEVRTAPRGVDVLAFYDRESRAAELRAEGMREWAVAVRLAEEETRARRSGVEVSARDLATARQGTEAVRLVEEAERRAREAQREGRSPGGRAAGEPPPNETRPGPE